jgi:pimeloyl-ACP methyl ester carboxylesterase
MEAMMRDLAAVVERTGLQSFALEAWLNSVPIAVTYAATFPDRVSHLILVDGWTSLFDIAGMPARKAMEALIDQDWTVQTETLARVLLGMDDPEIIEGFGEYMRTCIEPEAFRAFLAAEKGWDVVGPPASCHSSNAGVAK